MLGLDICCPCRCADFDPSNAEVAFTVKLASSHPILGIRILAGLDGYEFSVCAGAAPGDNGQCDTFSGSNTQQTYSLSQMVFGEYVTITVSDIGVSLNVCELEILVDDCATPAPTTPAPTGGPTPEPTAPAPTGGPTPEPTAPAPTGGPTPEPTAPAPTGGPTPEPTAPAPTGGPTPEPTAPAPTGGPTPEPTAPAPTGGPTPEPTAPAPTGGPTPDGSYQQPCDTDSAKFFIDAALSDSGTSTEELADSIGCTLAELKQQISEYVENTKGDISDSVAGFKSEMDKTINHFLAEDRARVETVVQAAASSATSASQLRIMAEVLINTQLAQNTNMMNVLIERAVRNDFSIEEVRADMVAALADTDGKSKAVQRLASYATGRDYTIADEMGSFIALQAAALRQSGEVLETVNSLTRAFGTSSSLVESTMATVFAASTGAKEESAMELIEAVASHDLGPAAFVLLTGLNDQKANSPLLAVLAAARENEGEFVKMKDAITDFVHSSASNGKGSSGLGPKIEIDLHQLELGVERLQQKLGDSATHARKKVSLSKLVPELARSGAEAAAKNARDGAKKASAQARY